MDKIKLSVLAIILVVGVLNVEKNKGNNAHDGCGVNAVALGHRVTAAGEKYLVCRYEEEAAYSVRR